MNEVVEVRQHQNVSKYDAACAALAEALTVDEAKDIRDKNEAMRVYARQAKNKDMEAQAAEIRFRAERRIGQLMAAQKDAGLMNSGTAGTGNSNVSGGLKENPPVKPAPHTLEEVGIDKNLANRARKLADIEEYVFEDTINEWRDAISVANEKVTVNLLGVKDKSKSFVENNSGNNEWYTPIQILEAARAVLGVIEFDPASCEIANATVGARKFFTIKDDALAQEWPVAKTWMNPPYSGGLVKPFIEKLIQQVKEGSEAIVLINNATETAWFQSLAVNASAVCFHKGRIKYNTPEGQGSGAPLQGQAIIYLGPNEEVFRRHFEPLGVVL